MKSNTSRFIIGVLLLIAAIFFVKKFVNDTPQVPRATLSFSPSELKLPSDAELRVMADVKNNNLAYGRIEVNFDKELVEVAGDIVPSNQLATVIEMTSVEEANNLGKVVITLGLKPGDQAPTGSFEFAKIPLKAKEGAKGNTKVTINEPSVQLVNLDTKVLPFEIKEAAITFE